MRLGNAAFSPMARSWLIALLMRWTYLTVFLATAACGGPDHLSVRGEVAVEAPDGTPTGFEFTRDTRLVDEDFAGSDTSLIAGRCRIGSDAAGSEFVSLAVSRPGARAEGAQLRRVYLQLSTRAPEGSVEADLGGELYRAEVDRGGCAELLYVERGEGLVGVSFDCALTGTGGEAIARGELHYEGCDVEP